MVRSLGSTHPTSGKVDTAEILGFLTRSVDPTRRASGLEMGRYFLLIPSNGSELRGLGIQPSIALRFGQQRLGMDDG